MIMFSRQIIKKIKVAANMNRRREYNAYLR